MRQFRSEFVNSYKTYSFGYSEYAEYEEGDKLSDLYEKGFLPYSGSPDIKRTLYMARSARINLEKFNLNSENRRIAKKFDGSLSRNSTPLSEFNYKDKDFISFCTKYFAERHGENVMPKERLLTILESDFPISIITYTHKENSEIIGYAIEVNDGSMGHYWYSFYDLKYINQSLGLWIMLDSIKEAQKMGKDYYYIGTVYGDKALYKTNFDALEFFDGNVWSSDIKKLKEISRQDEDFTIEKKDRWKKGKEIF